MKLQLYTIMPLDPAHLEEICCDIREQYESGTATCALFKMTLVPEGNPPVDKVGILCAQYDLFKKRLTEMGLGSGILVQASIGHGWVLSEMFPYQQYTSIESGEQSSVVCPLDSGFGAYIRHVFAVIAEHHPDTIMLDDDFRLMGRSGRGCGCPLHVAAFNRLAGTAFSREDIWHAVHEDGAAGDRYNDIFIKTQKDALLSCARMMREGIDSVDSTIPCSFCCVGNNAEFAAEIAEILAGTAADGTPHPRVVRINNGHYTAAGPRFFSTVFFRAAQSVSKLRGKVDLILAETDTCPQNRYSTSAMSLHTHFTGTLLEGACGAKHWITRLSAFEPESGRAYRRILGTHAGFYQTIADLVPHLTWRGCRIPTTDTACFDFRKSRYGYCAWSECVLERLGLPMYFSSDPGGVVCLEGDADTQFTDAELREILRGPVFLASDTAEHLIARGFGADLGVAVRPWTGKQPSLEKLPCRGNTVSVQQQVKELVVTDPRAKEYSAVYHTVDRVNLEYLFPGTVIFHNDRGGTVFTFSGTPRAAYNLVEAFSFLTYSRKQQLIEMLSMTEELPVYYPEDAEVYLRAADTEDGRLFCAVFNLGLDPLETLPLVIRRPVSGISMLTPDGKWTPVPYTKREAEVTELAIPCRTLDPVLLMLN